MWNGQHLGLHALEAQGARYLPHEYTVISPLKLTQSDGRSIGSHFRERQISIMPNKLFCSSVYHPIQGDIQKDKNYYYDIAG